MGEGIQVFCQTRTNGLRCVTRILVVHLVIGEAMIELLNICFRQAKATTATGMFICSR